jgi:hypothetical protein
MRMMRRLLSKLGGTIGAGTIGPLSTGGRRDLTPERNLRNLWIKLIFICVNLRSSVVSFRCLVLGGIP